MGANVVPLHPDTGDAVYVGAGELWKLAEFKSVDTEYGTGGVYKIDFPLKFTHQNDASFTNALDFADCRFEVDGANGGSLHGYNGVSQQLTATTLNPAVPFITFKGHVVMNWLTVVGVGVAFDADGTTAGGSAAAFINVGPMVVIGCPTLGTFKNYISFIANETAFTLCGRLTLQDVGSVILRICQFASMSGTVEVLGTTRIGDLDTVRFSPLDGVTALTVPAATTILETFSLKTCVFLLDFVGSVGLAVEEGVTMRAEALNLSLCDFATTAGLAPVGTPIPLAGHLDGESTKSRFVGCRNIENSSSSGYYTTMGNTEATPNVAPGTPVVAVLTPPLGAVVIEKDERVTISPAGRLTYIGGVPIRGKATWILSIIGQANKEAMAYVGIGRTGAAPIAAAAVLITGVPAPLNVGGNATSITVIHEFDMVTGTFAEPWIDADSGEPTVVSIKAFLEKVG